MFFVNARPASDGSNQRRGHVSRKARAGKHTRARVANVHSREMIEKLETRTLLTTLTGGGPGITRTYEFLDGSQNVIRIAMRGNIVAEAVGVWVRASDNEAP